MGKSVQNNRHHISVAVQPVSTVRAVYGESQPTPAIVGRWQPKSIQIHDVRYTDTANENKCYKTEEGLCRVRYDSNDDGGGYDSKHVLND